MNFEWILLALFLIAIISGVSKARRKSMLRNILRFGSLIFAFAVSFALQLSGVFQGIVVTAFDQLGVWSMLPELGGLDNIVSAVASMVVSPIFFFVVFFAVLWVCRIVSYAIGRGAEKRALRRAAEKEAEETSREYVDSPVESVACANAEPTLHIPVPVVSPEATDAPEPTASPIAQPVAQDDNTAENSEECAECDEDLTPRQRKRALMERKKQELALQKQRDNIRRKKRLAFKQKKHKVTEDAAPSDIPESPEQSIAEISVPEIGATAEQPKLESITEKKSKVKKQQRAAKTEKIKGAVLKKEHRKIKKRYVFYPEGALKRVVSFAVSITGSIIMLGILLMPVFYLMSIATAVTDGIENSDAKDSPIYKVVAVADEEITTPFNESLVAKFYSKVGITELMNYTVRAGGKIALDNGEATYTDDILKNLLAHSVSLASQLTSAESEYPTAKKDLDAIVTDPYISSVLADVIIMALNEAEVPEPEEGDFGEEIVYDMYLSYKNADKSVIESDVKALSSVAGVLIENGLFAGIISENLDMESVLADKELVGEVVEAISALSVFGPTMENAFELGIRMLGETLQIPEGNLEAYDDFIENLLLHMKKDDSTAFDINVIKYYVYNCAHQGVKVSSTNGIKGHKQFMAYVAHWEKVQAAFANASEDRSYGYFTIEINGEWFVYDKTAKSIVIYTGEKQSEYKDKISPVAGLINALTLYSSTKQLEADNLYAILTAYASGATDAESVALANRMLSRDTFVTKAVTIEKMLASVNFTDWDEEERKNDSRICADIIFNVMDIAENLQSMESGDSKDEANRMLGQFELLGQTMDDMKRTTCIKELPPLLIEGLVKNETFSEFMKPSIIFQINDIVREGDKTYADAMKQIGSIIKFAVNSLGGEI